jgi:N-carbamoyl-L-amino-acid hydrolase
MELAAAAMDERLGSMIVAAAEALGSPSIRMPSGAGHDAMIPARYLPTAMLFVPSIGGRSHDVAENTTEADIVLGAEVLTAVVERLIAAEPPWNVPHGAVSSSKAVF